MPLPPAGWYHDPTARFPHRYWDGRIWTEHVSNGGVTGVDPIQADQAVPAPAAGSQAPGAPAPPTYIRVTETTVGDTSGGSIGWVMAVLVVLAALVVAYALFSGGGDDGTPATTEPVATTAVTPETTTAPDETSPPETTTPPETTVPPETTAPPETTEAPTTTAAG